LQKSTNVVQFHVLMACVWILLEITFAYVKLGILDTTEVKVLYENFFNLLLIHLN